MSELDHVAVFTRVVSAGGFSAGARRLGIPKSSASRSVKQLEQALGVQLLQRTTRRLRLTDAGQEYYERVVSALAGLDEARAAVMERQDTPRGVVRMAAPPDRWGLVLAPFIAQFIRAHPGIRIDLSLTSRDVDLVRDGFDLALKVGRLSDSSLMVRVVGSVDRGLFASADYLARRGALERLADLSAHDFIVCLGHEGARRVELQGPNGLERVRVDGPVASDDVTFMHEAVRFGMGVGLLPVSACVAHLGLVRVLPEYSEPGLTCSLVYPATRYMPQRVVLFRDALIEDLQQRLTDKLASGAHCDARTLQPPRKKPRASRTKREKAFLSRPRPTLRDS